MKKDLKKLVLWHKTNKQKPRNLSDSLSFITDSQGDVGSDRFLILKWSVWYR